MKTTLYRLIVVSLITGYLAGPNLAVSSESASANAPGLPADSASLYLPLLQRGREASWPTVAANPERTSWTPEEVSGNLGVEWYRPIEAYIPQNAQLIASDGLIFVSTARGLYALNAANGDVAWRFDTELPLGNSPTVADGVVYVGGYDRKLHALRTSDGFELWAFEGAQAGFSTNPVVVEGKVFAGNRDGAMYAIGAHGTPNQGQLLWKYQTGGLIDISAAYKDGVVYFASNDNYAYALQADNGALVWESARLPGDGLQSYWPVIYRDKVIFAAATDYRLGLDPGTKSVIDTAGAGYASFNEIQRDDLFDGQSDGTIIGPPVENQTWAHGKTVIDGSRITQYLEANPNPDPHLHKPWRRFFIVLNRSDGSEYTFDSDGDGYPEYMPITYAGTGSGNRYPPLVGPDDTLYQSNIYQRFYIPQGRVMGWQMGTPYLSLVGGQGAIDEPQAISAGGNLIYRSICCDRVGDWFSITTNEFRQLWSYSTPLSTLAPGYDVMWYLEPPEQAGGEPGGMARLHGNYGTVNGIYHNHGDQNPIIPYQGKLFIHRSNAVIAFGPGQGPGQLPLLEINDVQETLATPTGDDLNARLEAEVQKIVNAGHLRPGYYNAGQFSRYTELASYFENPGDTLYTLARAYPHLSSQLQLQIKAYLRSEFQAYFDPVMYTQMGWAEGAPREAMPLPPEVEASLSDHPKSMVSQRWSWQYPPHNFYAMWKYAEIFPEDAVTVYELAKSKIQVPVPPMATNDYLFQRPFEHNAYIAGYLGFLRLQELAGKTIVDSQLRTNVQGELDRLLALRANTFTKDTYWIQGVPRYSWHLRPLNISRNFIFLTPELGDYLNQNALAQVQAAVDEYNWIAPYWFVARYNAVINEGVRQNLYDYPALFQAKAYILKEDRAELAKYLDVPAFERGDLFYIQNLIAALEAAPPSLGPASADQPASGCRRVTEP